MKAINKIVIGILAIIFLIMSSTPFGCVPSNTKYFTVGGTDKISITSVQEHETEANVVRFNFATAPEVTLWKGVKVYDKNDNEILFLETENGHHGLGFLNRFDISQFGEEIKVEFWKEKESNKRTLVETKYFKSSDLNGFISVLYWMND